LVVCAAVSSLCGVLKKPLLRKICLGGLYVPPEWPQGVLRSSDVQLKLDSIVVE